MIFIAGNYKQASHCNHCTLVEEAIDPDMAAASREPLLLHQFLSGFWNQSHLS